MKILIHSSGCDSNGLAFRLEKEGHKVLIYTKNPEFRESMKNMVEHVPSLVDGIRQKPDFVLFDMTGNGETADGLRKAGVNVLASCALADKMELDRKFGIDMMRKAGIKVPVTNHFGTVHEAIAYIKKNPNAYAVKMDGDKGTASSYVSKDDKDMIEHLEYQMEIGAIKRGVTFVLQEVVKGVEISTEVWFSHGKPVFPANSTFETKKFMPGDLGPTTGSETSIVFPYMSERPKIIEKTLSKIFPIMEKEKWTGPLDINCIISEKDHEPYGLEWTPRIGYSAIYALSAMIDSGIGEFLHGIASGTAKRVPVRHSWGSALKLSIPPYPFDDPDEEDIVHSLFEKTAGQKVKAHDSNDWWPIDVKKDEKGRFLTAGLNGIIGECTGVGSTLYDAWKGSQNAFKQVEVAAKQGRYVDGSERAFRDILKLKGWGYDVPSPSGRELRQSVMAQSR